MARRRKGQAPEQWPEWWRNAWQQVEPDLDGNRDIKKIHELAITALQEDEGALAEMAAARVEQFQRELTRGVTQPIRGQLQLPGFEAEDWRPDQLYIIGDDAVRAADAKPKMLNAKAEASMANAKRQIDAAARLQARGNRYSEWFTEQVVGGRDPRVLSQQVWLDESGYLRNEE